MTPIWSAIFTGLAVAFLVLYSILVWSGSEWNASRRNAFVSAALALFIFVFFWTAARAAG